MTEKSQDKARRYVLRFYNANRVAESQEFAKRLEDAVCSCFGGECRVEFVNVMENPERAVENDIFATPMLVKELPEPLNRILGDLNDPHRVLVLLGLIAEEQERQ